MPYQIVELPSYRAIGLKWVGTYAEIVPHLKNIIRQMEERAQELKYRIHPNFQLGLSYHVVENGFVHYSVYEVSEKQTVPEGMVEMRIPAWTYVKATHHKGEDVQQTYLNLYQWLEASEYTTYKEQGVKYYEKMLPIKHEHYPEDRDRNNPHFDIYIPIVKK